MNPMRLARLRAFTSAAALPARHAIATPRTMDRETLLLIDCSTEMRVISPALCMRFGSRRMTGKCGFATHCSWHVDSTASPYNVAAWLLGTVSNPAGRGRHLMHRVRRDPHPRMAWIYYRSNVPMLSSGIHTHRSYCRLAWVSTRGPRASCSGIDRALQEPAHPHALPRSASSRTL